MAPLLALSAADILLFASLTFLTRSNTPAL
jgi:hypothetical protein